MAQFHALCKECDLKVTHQRVEIFRALLQTIDHPTAEEVFKRIRDKLPTISIDTVYRTLALFEEHNLIARVQCLSDKGRFDPNMDKHHHFICMQCKKICDFYWEAFDTLTLPPEVAAFGTVILEKVELRGICAACKKNNAR
ncbi:MAG: transcriptional repressor [bacterium]|nr:transcriptional repressor [bacterium]